MTISYENIYNRFLQKVDDIEFLQLDRNTAYEKMKGWLTTALSVPYTRRLFETLVKNDEIMELEYTLKHPVEEGYDQDFIEEALSLGVLVEWLKEAAQYRTEAMRQFHGGKEEKWYSEANHVREINNLYESTRKEWHRFIQDRGYINNIYLDGQ